MQSGSYLVRSLDHPERTAVVYVPDSSPDLRQGRRPAIVAFIADYNAQHGYGPSLREIGAAVGLRSSASVIHHLKVLTTSGRIAERDPGSLRTIRLVKS